jgi:hypothetical protein
VSREEIREREEEKEVRGIRKKAFHVDPTQYEIITLKPQIDVLN